jgi:hypothetical protein
VGYNPDAELDTSQVSDDRGLSDGSGGGGLGGRVALGGGGVSIVGLVIYLLMSQLGGGSIGALPSLPEAGGPSNATNSGKIQEYCKFARDATAHPECETVAAINSIQDYWKNEFSESGRTYKPAVTHVFSRATQTGCGSASADVGPFYCPADGNVYIDLSFYNELKQRFGAHGGWFARAYVLAHEYGHHVQDLLAQSAGSRASGATSGSVRLELQADCYAGVWAFHAQQTKTASGKPLIEGVSQNDIDAALDTAGRIGDDFIQSEIAGRQVNESQFTHGSSAQREKWLLTGLKTGDPSRCNTFARGVNLG